MTDPFERPMRRREVLRGGAGLALGLGLAGCGVGSGQDQEAAKKATERVVQAKPDGDLALFNWADYLEPKVIEGFEKRYGVKVRPSYFDSMEPMLAKLRAGNRYDIVFPTSDYTARMIKANMFLRLDREKLRNAGGIYSFFDDPFYDPGSRFTVPYTMYTTGIVFREDKVKDMAGSWRDLMQEEARGRTYMLDDFKEAIGQANLINGADLNAFDPAVLERSKRTLLEQKEYLRGYSTNALPNMLNGNAWVHHAWNGEVVNIRSQSKRPERLKYQTCREGIPVGSDCMAIPANAPHPGTALLFIDWVMAPENLAQNVNFHGYPMPYDGAKETFAKLVEDDPAIDVTVEDLQKGTQFKALSTEERKKWDRVWTEVKAA